jgi:hypothetical protein
MSKPFISLGMLLLTLLGITWFQLEQFRLGYDVAQSMSSFRRSEDAYKLKLVAYSKRTGLPTLHSVAQVESELAKPASEQIINLRVASF